MEKIVVIKHEHKHGVDIYPVVCEGDFSLEDAVAALKIDYDPDKMDESIDWDEHAIVMLQPQQKPSLVDQLKALQEQDESTISNQDWFTDDQLAIIAKVQSGELVPTGTQKLTAEEIEQHAAEFPNEGFDICSKCNEAQEANTMESLNNSINCTALICEECQNSEDTVYNHCSNCNFDMGENFENCGGSEDGVCPECGTDSAAPVAKQKVHVKSYDDEDGAAWKLMFGDEVVEDGFQSTADAEMWARDHGYIPMSEEPERYRVTICRTGYGFTSIDVQARSPEEAEDLAHDEAGDHIYSEKSSEFTTDGVQRL